MPQKGCRTGRICFRLVQHPFDKSARRNQFLHKLWKSLSLIFRTFGQIIDFSAVEINFHFIAGFNRLCCLRTFNNRQSDIDSIAVENTCKCFRDNAAYARRLQAEGCVLSGRAAAEILIGDNHVTRLHFLCEVRINIYHCMACQFLCVKRIQISCRDDHICINIITVFKNMAFCSHYISPTFSGFAMQPAMALAAATSGDAR